MKTKFKEEQKFTQWWLWLILIPVGVLPIIGVYKQILLGEPFGANPISDLGLMIFSIFIFSLIGLCFIVRLKTEIDMEQIQMSFFPFVKKKTQWCEIRKAEVVNYGFVGGWGIRRWTKYGTIYTVKGSKGLAIELLNGEKFLVGTQKDTELKEIIKKVIKEHGTTAD